jgi:hypothetical protein
MSMNAKIFTALVVLIVACTAAYFLSTQWLDKSVERAVDQEKAQWDQEKEAYQKKIGDLEEEIDLHREEIISGDRLEEVFGKEAGDMAAASAERACQDLDREINDFFTYLDKQDYIRDAGLEEGSRARFLRMVKALSRNPPLVLGEMKDNYSLIKNIAHFFRVLGKKNVLLIRRTLQRENEVIEPIAALFYDWSGSADRCGDGIKGQPSLKIQYEYASFFLNTLAGKSYLLRRDSTVRILTTYYSILIIDRANDETLNRYGLDIRPFIQNSMHEIGNQKGLIFTKRYLDTLQQLQEKYTIR